MERSTGIPKRLTKQSAIQEITRRLVDYYSPVRIYLFGSEARGDAGPDSDLDFCVVLPDERLLRSAGQESTVPFGG
jgi:predicted nucleotidyltransferase